MSRLPFKALVVSRNFNPGHYSHLSANYKLLSESGVDTFMYHHDSFNKMGEIGRERIIKNIFELKDFGKTVSNIVSPLMVTADRFMISSVIGAVVVAYYSVPFEALFRILLLPSALSAALFPKIASFITTDLVAAKKLYLKSVSVVTTVLAKISLILALSTHLWLSIWLGVDFADKSWIVASILAIGICFNGIAQMPYAVIQAAGDAQLAARIYFTELFFYIPILYLSIKYFGIAAAAGV